MSNHIANRRERWSKKPETFPSQLCFYDVHEITKPKGTPYFAVVMRAFSSRRELSRYEYEALVAAIDRGYYVFQNVHSSSRHDEFMNWQLTVRRARRVFWELIARDNQATAKKLLETCFEFLERCYRHCGEREIVEAIYDAVALFTLDRYVLDDSGYKFFSPRMLKLLFAKAAQASGEVLELVCTTVLEKELNMISRFGRVKAPSSISSHEWECLNQILLALAEVVGKRRLSPKVKRLLGRLLTVLAAAKFDNSDYEHDRGKKIALASYRASVKTTLSEVRRWLDGKELKFGT